MKKAILTAIIGLILSTNSIAWTLFGSSTPKCDDKKVKELALEQVRSVFELLNQQLELVISRGGLGLVNGDSDMSFMRAESGPYTLRRYTLDNTPMLGPLYQVDSPTRFSIKNVRTDSSNDKIEKSECSAAIYDVKTNWQVDWSYTAWNTEDGVYVKIEE